MQSREVLFLQICWRVASSRLPGTQSPTVVDHPVWLSVERCLQEVAPAA